MLKGKITGNSAAAGGLAPQQPNAKVITNKSLDLIRTLVANRNATIVHYKAAFATMLADYEASHPQVAAAVKQSSLINARIIAINAMLKEIVTKLELLSPTTGQQVHTYLDLTELYNTVIKAIASYKRNTQATTADLGREEGLIASLGEIFTREKWVGLKDIFETEQARAHKTSQPHRAATGDAGEVRITREHAGAVASSLKQPPLVRNAFRMTFAVLHQTLQCPEKEFVAMVERDHKTWEQMRATGHHERQSRQAAVRKIGVPSILIDIEGSGEAVSVSGTSVVTDEEGALSTNARKLTANLPVRAEPQPAAITGVDKGDDKKMAGNTLRVPSIITRRQPSTSLDSGGAASFNKTKVPSGTMFAAHKSGTAGKGGQDTAANSTAAPAPAKPAASNRPPRAVSTAQLNK